MGSPTSCNATGNSSFRWFCASKHFIIVALDKLLQRDLDESHFFAACEKIIKLFLTAIIAIFPINTFKCFESPTIKSSAAVYGHINTFMIVICHFHNLSHNWVNHHLFFAYQFRQLSNHRVKFKEMKLFPAIPRELIPRFNFFSANYLLFLCKRFGHSFFN